MPKFHNMKIKFFLFFFLIVLNNSFGKIDYFSYNFFNFYRKPILFYFNVNSTGDQLEIFHAHRPVNNKRLVSIFLKPNNFQIYLSENTIDPVSYSKGDSATGKVSQYSGDLIPDTPRVGVQGKGDVYLMMFRLNPDSSRNYGWLKFNISEDGDSLYFISSGFNTIINDPVVAGEGEWALSKPYFNPDFKLFPNPSSAFRLEIPESYFNSNIFIEIMDLNGKIIHKNPYQNQPFSLPIP